MAGDGTECSFRGAGCVAQIPGPFSAGISAVAVGGYRTFTADAGLPAGRSSSFRHHDSLSGVELAYRVAIVTLCPGPQRRGALRTDPFLPPVALGLQGQPSGRDHLIYSTRRLIQAVAGG